jgi:hypothetical protein
LNGNLNVQQEGSKHILYLKKERVQKMKTSEFYVEKEKFIWYLAPPWVAMCEP